MRLPAVLTCLLALGAAAPPPPAPLLPRALLVGTPARASPRLSPDGRRLAYLAPDGQGVPQAWVRTLGQQDDVSLTAEPRRGARGLAWAEDSASLLVSLDPAGGEALHLLQVELAQGTVRDLTPWQGVTGRLLATSARLPDQLLVELNLRDRSLVDVARVSLRTGAVELDTVNPGDVERWVVDGALAVRGARATTAEGGTELRVRDGAQGPFRALVTAGLEETLELVDFTEDGRGAVLATSIDADAQRVVEKSLKTGAERPLGRSEGSDLLAVLGHPTRRQVRALGFEVQGRLRWTALDWRVKDDLEALARAVEGDFAVVSMDAADARWVVEARRDTAPPRYLLWDRKARKAEGLFDGPPPLEGLVERRPAGFAARDGTPLSGWLTRPAGTSGPGPLVLLVHGGPWSRDGWGFDGQAQLLANRGYAVLQLNFRGSTGAGKRFLGLGNRQWGLAMLDDLLDAVAWAVREGVADPARVAVMGAGLGGTAALQGLAFSPGTFACGVEVMGPTSAASWLASAPPWLRPRLLRRVGDPGRPEDAELLARASPGLAAGQVAAPLLLAQGGADGRFPASDAEALVLALRQRGVPVTWVTYPEERGPDTLRPENRLDLAGRVETFLARCLGGRAEALPPEGRVSGASAVPR